MEDLMLTKLVTSLILGIVCLGIGLVAFGLRRALGLSVGQAKRKQIVFTSLLLCFGAGVLLCTALLHIMPEVREGLEAHGKSLGVNWLPDLVFCAGFFLIYLVEEGVQQVLHCTTHTEQFHRSLTLRRTSKVDCVEDSACNNGEINDTCSQVSECPTKDCFNDMQIPPSESSSQGGSTQAIYPAKCQMKQSLTSGPATSPKSLEATLNAQFHHQHAPLATPGPIRDVFTVLALSIHAVFEGLAVGLESSSSNVWTMFAAIASHKFVITFCVSLELLQAGTSTVGFSLALITFSLVSPMGIGIGMAISELSSSDSQMIVSIFQGISAGTIIYVVMFEVLQREMVRDVPGLMQLMGVMVGFGSMLMIQIFTHHKHHNNNNAEEGEEEKLLQMAKALCPSLLLPNSTLIDF